MTTITARWCVAAFLLSALAVSCGRGTRAAPAASKSGPEQAPVVEVVKVVSQKLQMTVRLPGEIQPYEVVAVYPKITGFVDWIGVDRGSRVKKGQLIARLVAPEIASQRAEAQAKLQSAAAVHNEAEAMLASDEGTYQGLAAAAKTPGVVAGNDLVVAQKKVDADRARVKAMQNSEDAARQALHSVEQIEGYLRIAAPFDGVVTERNVHPGALVGPGGGPGIAVPLVRIETLSRLRVVVAVPELYAAGIPEGTPVSFSVPAFPGEAFHGTVARIAHSVDARTRTMPVELEVTNPSGRLASGMFPEVAWPVRRPEPTLFVPGTAVARTLEQTFVVRVAGGKTEWVPVKTGATAGNLVEVFGNLREGDEVAVRASEELRPGTAVTPRP